MHIYLWGQRNLYGGGVHFSNFSDSLKELILLKDMVIEVDIRGQDIQQIASNTKSNDIHVLFFPLDIELSIKGTVIKWGIFESDLLTEQYVNYLSESHLVWVPSRWARKVLIKNGMDEKKIDVVPEGVNPKIYHPFNKNFFLEDKFFRFYMIGKNEKRKGINELLEGFKLAFDNDPKINLFLKADNFWSDKYKKTDKNKELFSLIKDFKLTNVKLLTGKLKLHEISMIHACCDVFILPTRAEGWGLPLIEALASGSPVITNYYSGQTEYLENVKDNVKLLDFKVCSIGSEDLISNTKFGGTWAISSIESIAKSMIEIKKNYLNFITKSYEASNTIRKNFSWNNAANCAVESLIKNQFLDIKIEKPF